MSGWVCNGMDQARNRLLGLFSQLAFVGQLQVDSERASLAHGNPGDKAENHPLTHGQPAGHALP